MEVQTRGPGCRSEDTLTCEWHSENGRLLVWPGVLSRGVGPSRVRIPPPRTIENVLTGSLWFPEWLVVLLRLKRLKELRDMLHSHGRVDDEITGLERSMSAGGPCRIVVSHIRRKIGLREKERMQSRSIYFAQSREGSLPPLFQKSRQRILCEGESTFHF